MRRSFFALAAMACLAAASYALMPILTAPTIDFSSARLVTHDATIFEVGDLVGILYAVAVLAIVALLLSVTVFRRPLPAIGHFGALTAYRHIDPGRRGFRFG